MKRITDAMLVMLGLGLGLGLGFGTKQSFAQQVSMPASDATLLHRSFASVAPNSLATEQTDPNSIPGNFPSLRPESETEQSGRPRSEAPVPFSGSLITVGSSLTVVLGLFAALVWVTRKFASRSMPQGGIPTEVLQALGSSPIDARTRLTLVRCGNRILVLAQTATGVQPISEITDPNEVRQLTALCLSDSKKEFASTLRAIEQEKATSNYVGEAKENKPGRSHSAGRLFTTA